MLPDGTYDIVIPWDTPVSVHEGDNAEVLAKLFAARHGLDAATRGELALAIVERAKQLGLVRPLFVLQVCRLLAA